MYLGNDSIWGRKTTREGRILNAAKVCSIGLSWQIMRRTIESVTDRTSHNIFVSDIVHGDFLHMARDVKFNCASGNTRTLGDLFITSQEHRNPLFKTDDFR